MQRTGRQLRAARIVPVPSAMETKTVHSKRDANPGNNGRFAAKTRAKITRAVRKAGSAASDVQGKVEEIAEEGGHRLQETAMKARHTAKQIATEVVHSAQQTAQKVVHGAQEMANSAQHRRQENADQSLRQDKRR